MSDNIVESLNFIEEIIENDIANNKNEARVHTRFPPEPNGFLHIGHAKSICLNFGLGQKYGGKTNLRFDDTNPTTEDTAYVNAIKKDIEWLGFEWDNEAYYASDYFDQLYEYARQLIQKGLAYVDDSTSEEIAALKGTPTEPGKDSPYRSRSVEENLDLFEKMKLGFFDDGAKILRAKIDMSSPNMLMRDPIMYRIKKEKHHRTGDVWNIYPMYDFAHGICDSIEKITHSICTLEFENHRPLYDWFLENLGIFHSQQIEFARLNLTYTVMSKRKLLQLVNEKIVNGWDDPRMSTLSGYRRKGYTPESIRNFAKRIGVSKRDNLIDVGLLEFSVREHLNKIAPRTMAVLNPLKVTLTNYPEGKIEHLPTQINPEDENSGFRDMVFSRNLWIEQDDFMENPPKKYFRLTPGGMVRLKNGYIIKCDEVVKNENEEIIELLCSYVENSKSGSDESGIQVKGVIHWLSADNSIDAEVRLYDRLFTVENPAMEKDADFKDFINPDSLEIISNAKIEPYLKNYKEGDSFQFLRLGYFCIDRDSSQEKLVFNKTVGLKDSWAKEVKKQG